MSNTLQIGEVVENRFQILSLLGSGSQAKIFKAKDTSSGKIVAIKQYSDVDVYEKEDVEQIEREYTILQQINHPNIMKCFQILHYPTTILLVLEYIEGLQLTSFIMEQFPEKQKIIIEDLVVFKDVYTELVPLIDSTDITFRYQSMMRQLLKNKLKIRPIAVKSLSKSYKIGEIRNEQQKYEQCKRSSTMTVTTNIEVNEVQIVEASQSHDLNNETAYETSVLHIFQQIIDVLGFLQEANVMHRDMKPDNILVTRDLTIKLIDFGFVRQRDMSSTMVGTPGFLAPEIAIQAMREQKYTSKVDVWAAGVILYQMLFGYVPFVITRCMDFMKLQASRGLYLPPDIFGENLVDQRYLNMIERIFIVDPDKRPDARRLQQLFIQYTDVPTADKRQMKTIKVMLIGNYGVGKTTILNKMARNTISQQQLQVLTRQIRVDTEIVQLEFFDTMGTEATTRSLMPAIVRGVELLFLCWANKPDCGTESAKFYLKQYFGQNVTAVVRGICSDFGTGAECTMMEGVETKVVERFGYVDDLLVAAVRQCIQEGKFHFKNSVVMEERPDVEKQCC